MTLILSCVDFAGPDTPGCCTSCHDDVDQGYGDLCGPLSPTTRTDVSAETCCSVANWLDEHPAPRSIWARAIRTLRRRVSA